MWQGIHLAPTGPPLGTLAGSLAVLWTRLLGGWRDPTLVTARGGWSRARVAGYIERSQASDSGRADRRICSDPYGGLHVSGITRTGSGATHRGCTAVCIDPQGSTRSRATGHVAGIDCFAGSGVRVDPAGQIRAAELCERTEGLERLRSSNWKSTKQVAASARNRHRDCSTAACASPSAIARQHGACDRVRAQRGNQHPGLLGWMRKAATGFGGCATYLARGLSVPMRECPAWTSSDRTIESMDFGIRLAGCKGWPPANGANLVPVGRFPPALVATRSWGWSEMVPSGSMLLAGCHRTGGAWEGSKTSRIRTSPERPRFATSLIVRYER